MHNVRVLLTLVAALILAACSAQGAPEAGPTASATDAPETPTLAETYTSQSGRIAFQHPAGWIVREMGADLILAASSEAAADKAFSTAAFDAGEVAVQLSLSTRTDAAQPAGEHLTGFASSIGIPLGEPSGQTFGGRPGARVDGEGGGRHLMAAAILFDDSIEVVTGSGDTYVLAITYADPAEFAQRESTLLAILNSITFSDTTEE